jgi:RHS repeat-associated protein
VGAGIDVFSEPRENILTRRANQRHYRIITQLETPSPCRPPITQARRAGSIKCTVTVIPPLNNRHVTYQTDRGRVVKDALVLSSGFGNVFGDTQQQNGIINVTTNQYDGLDRPQVTFFPERGAVQYTYVTNVNPWANNLFFALQFSKPGFSDASSVSFTYDPIYNKPTSITDTRGLVSTLDYDPATGNPRSATNDAGAGRFNATSRYTYNAVGQVLTATDPQGTVTQFNYDGFGNQTSVVRDAGASRLNQTTSFGFNVRGDVISIADPLGNLTTNTYDAARRLTATTAPNGLVTAYSYDPNGQTIRVQQSTNGTLLRSTGATYTLTGKPATVSDANNNPTIFSYDLLDRVSSVRDAMGRTTSYGYDALSRQTSISNLAIQSAPLVQKSYTPDGLLASLTDANNHTTSFGYDGLNRLATTTYPLGTTETLTYDADSNVLTRKTRANQTISYAYDTLNRLIAKTPPSPATAVNYRYDLNNRLISVSDGSAAIAAAVPPSGPSVQYAMNYSYDVVNRPTAVAWSPAPAAAAPLPSVVTFGHTYNTTNQRTGQTVSDNSWLNYPAATPSMVSYTANALNQYAAVGAVTPTYSANGNLTFDGTFTFGYDAENRLTSAAGAGNTAAYSYDAQGRRKTKTVNGATTVFVTDAGNREVLEYDGSSGAILRWYAYGLGSNEVLNQTNVVAGTRAALIPDIQGSVIASVDSVSGTFSKIGYLPYGKSASAPGSFGYTAQRIDPETNGLYYYRARQYSPAWGRFLQTDPIGMQGGINLYAYVGNDPLNFNDPDGMMKDAVYNAATAATNQLNPISTASATEFQTSLGSAFAISDNDAIAKLAREAFATAPVQPGSSADIKTTPGSNFDPYAAAAANPLVRQQAVSSGQIFVTPSGGYAGSLLLQAEGSAQLSGQTNPTKGIYEYLIPLNTSTLLGQPEITHQRFIPNAPISGYPNNTKGAFPPFSGL